MLDLLGLPLGEAEDRLRAAGQPVPPIIRAEPPRPRHPYPPAENWRVVRVDAAALVIAPPVPAPSAADEGGPRAQPDAGRPMC